ncbi:hypothetical protein IU500_23405 [Nocardia terpenica]|uniref:Uncharacterized protein n=1 Tax=Nocardia terpenica TaxID=455432 RepID=A0A164MUS7_9NOCA|nr:DUF5988 family protein [Nocardia terpenica]KZM73681.1 hypothetical protein AWN90_34430 [Nocardia terpenica]MBF6064385.1 hypothetical protein [Nocardia terpenica]MBF6106991.1 hypothetical protein [Nocardia terpenica]MBF6114353.1 hypothetical protein [Nocardia terpenica]MBF6121561.1 hypothetical protein [Nocardia terpenica]
MSTAVHAYLEGGPADLPDRIVPLTAPGAEVKVSRRGGYEHFTPTERFQETDQGRCPVFEWSYRTRVAE